MIAKLAIRMKALDDEEKNYLSKIFNTEWQSDYLLLGDILFLLILLTKILISLRNE